MAGKLNESVNPSDFMLYALGVVARSDVYHIDRHYSTPADFAQDVLEYLDVDPDDIEIERNERMAFVNYRAERRGLPPWPAKAQDGAQAASGEGWAAAVEDLYANTPAPLVSDIEKVKTGNGLMFWVGIFAITAAIFQMKGWPWALLFIGSVVAVSSLFAIVAVNRQSGSGQSDPGV